MARSRGGGGSRSGGRRSGGSRSRSRSHSHRCRSRSYRRGIRYSDNVCDTRSLDVFSSTPRNYSLYGIDSYIGSNEFANSVKHFYYEDNNEIEFYASEDLTGAYLKLEMPTKSKMIKDFLSKCTVGFIFFIAFFISAFIVLKTVYDPTPSNLELREGVEIEVYDHADMIEDVDNFVTQAEYFYSKTGLIPALMTIEAYKWQDDFDSLEAFALDRCYFLLDEQHILFVYSVDRSDDFVDWSWEQIYGDDSIGVLSDAACEALGDDFHKKLYTMPVADALAGALKKAADNYIPPYYCVLFVIIAFGVVWCLSRWMTYKGDVKYTYIKLGLCLRSISTTSNNNNAVDIVTCGYCTGTYARGKHSVCPHCGAAMGIE